MVAARHGKLWAVTASHGKLYVVITPRHGKLWVSTARHGKLQVVTVTPAATKNGEHLPRGGGNGLCGDKKVVTQPEPQPRRVEQSGANNATTATVIRDQFVTTFNTELIRYTAES